MGILLNALHGVAGKKRTPCKSLHGAAALNGRLPTRMAPNGLKLREHAFQVIPDISFFDKNFRLKIFVNTLKDVSAKCLFWRSYEGLDVTSRCASKIHCQTYRFQPSTTLGGRVKEAKTVFFVSFGLKTDLIPL